MKKLTITIAFLAFITLCALMITSANKPADNPLVNELSKLKLHIIPNKQIYILGEKIELEVQAKNESSEDISPLDSIAKNCAYLHIYIADESKVFKRYIGPGFQIEGCEINLLLKSGELFKTQSTVLWNGKPNQNELNIKSITEGRILTDYAIPETGVYFIKAVLKFSEEARLEDIESEPFQIVVNEPIGDELKVWNRIKDKGEIAYFIQKGFFQSSEVEEKEKLIREIEEITAKYPNSFLGSQMKQSLEKFSEREKRRKEKN